ncbi:hypothetical protein [Nocardioides daejeonensis]|uniref:hypothetical protein n=1 Tax=Nocardioides daejeonensis TaxID=1046556 RepID=UPI000D748449|nr:hypothetical protein [Nocardioides daejeonensis]
MDGDLPLEHRISATLDAADVTPGQHALATEVCHWVVATLPELDVRHRGRAARSAVRLFLDLHVPTLSTSLKSDLARLCEISVVLDR